MNMLHGTKSGYFSVAAALILIQIPYQLGLRCWICWHGPGFHAFSSAVAKARHRCFHFAEMVRGCPVLLSDPTCYLPPPRETKSNHCVQESVLMAKVSSTVW